MPPRSLSLIPTLMMVWALSLALVPRAAAEDLYTVSGLHVDASAASSAEALNLAIAQGRPRAWQILYRRLTRQADWARQPQLDAASLVRLSRSYLPANERRSTTRYVADVTYMFNPDAVSRTLRDANIAFTQTVVRRILLVPMSPNYNNGPWAQAFSAPSLHDSLVPFALPTAADSSDLSALNFDSASWNDVAAVAGRIKASEAALLQVVNVNGKMIVNVRRLGQGEAASKTQVEVPMVQGFNASFPAAAQAGLNAMEDLWKSRSVVNYNTRGTLTADVKVDSLNQWGAIQTALSGTNVVTNVLVVAMNTGYARLSIAYMGTPDQLRDALGEQGLALSNKSGQFTLMPGARLGGGR